MSDVVCVVGGGLLADFVCEKLSAEHRVVHQVDLTAGVPDEVQLALVLDDGWQPSAHRTAEETLQPAGIPWLRGFVTFGYGVIGPLVRPGKPGCSQCADLRRLMAGTDRKDMWELKQILGECGKSRRDAWVSRLGLWQMTEVLTAEVQRILQGCPPRSEEHVLLMNLKTMQSSLHLFLPDPQCPVCGGLPDDSPGAAQIPLHPTPKAGADSYRNRSAYELKDVVVKDYLDARTGLVNGEAHDLLSPFAAVSVNLPLFQTDEGTAGRTLSYGDGRWTAILEGLERYCGLAPRGKRTVVHDCLHNLGDRALNPVTVGVHAREQYAQPDFPFKPFHPERPIDWVWGYSFLQEQPILVPERLAYYSLGCGDGFVYETSNGCAVGGSLVEAIVHGILEVVERDSFLLTWYAQLPLPRLDPDSTDDQELRLMIDRFQRFTGYDLHLFNATMENGIPSVWALAKNKGRKGANLVCAAGSHLDPVRAVKGAIHELAGTLRMFDERLETNRKEYVRMVRDPFRVREMEDHSMLYALPEAEDRFRFLMEPHRPLHPFREQLQRWAWHEDLADDLRDILQAFRRLNLDVIVVDQTAPELQRNGLYCVKVLIPGMLPMTFGYHLTRLEGLERVLRVPMELGYTAKPLTSDQLNPHPHPFP